jgi:hypothetical protein
MTDRSHYPVRKVRLEDKEIGNDYSSFTPEERLAMVWTMTMQAWMFKEGIVEEPRMRRDVVHIVRGGPRRTRSLLDASELEG